VRTHKYDITTARIAAVRQNRIVRRTTRVKQIPRFPPLNVELVDIHPIIQGSR
jgi:hypothetical protein